MTSITPAPERTPHTCSYSWCETEWDYGYPGEHYGQLGYTRASLSAGDKKIGVVMSYVPSEDTHPQITVHIHGREGTDDVDAHLSLLEATDLLVNLSGAVEHGASFVAKVVLR